MDLKWLIGALIALAAFNCVVTLRVLRATGLTVAQKLAQSLIIWLLPLLGGVVVYLVHRSDGDPRGPKPPPFGGGAHDGMGGGVQ
jgi:hypothetical protein